jgi:formylglycine-generating enzyme required for sulfatase activity
MISLRTRARFGWFVCAAIVASPVVVASVAMPLVTVGDPGNPADATGFGAVANEYRIGTYEVTNGQYTAFLNAVAGADTNGLYNEGMQIARSGSPGAYTYATQAPDKPVTHVSWYDALRFVNWLHNGQPAGAQGPATTEGGAYTFTDTTAVGARNPGAKFFLPSETEWYKAAYYRGGADGGYALYPTQSDTPPEARTPAAAAGGANYANYDGAVEGVTDAGAYTGATGVYGTFDQAGNVWEWNETAIDSDRGLRGGSWDDYKLLLQRWYRDSQDPALEVEFVGFRVGAVPAGGVPFRRGDVNQSGGIDIGDAIYILTYLFASGTEPPCMASADSDDTGVLGIGDGIMILMYLFAGGDSLPAPFAACDLDPTPDLLGCETFAPCGGG